MDQSSKVNPREDDALKSGLSPLLRNTQVDHVEEWRQIEPSGEDQPLVNINPAGPLLGAVDEGMTRDDVMRRSELAQHLGKEVWPASAAILREKAMESQAPDWVLEEISRLPADQVFENNQDLWSTLGYGVETTRF